MFTIKDLTGSEEIDMSDVHGGNNGNSTTNTIGQQMSLSVPIAVLASGPANTNVHVNGMQNALIGNGETAGDSFLALLPFSR